MSGRSHAIGIAFDDLPSELAFAGRSASSKEAAPDAAVNLGAAGTHGWRLHGCLSEPLDIKKQAGDAAASAFHHQRAARWQVSATTPQTTQHLKQRSSSRSAVFRAQAGLRRGSCNATKLPR